MSPRRSVCAPFWSCKSFVGCCCGRAALFLNGVCGALCCRLLAALCCWLSGPHAANGAVFVGPVRCLHGGNCDAPDRVPFLSALIMCIRCLVQGLHITGPMLLVFRMCTSTCTSSPQHCLLASEAMYAFQTSTTYCWGSSDDWPHGNRPTAPVFMGLSQVAAGGPGVSCSFPQLISVVLQCSTTATLCDSFAALLLPTVQATFPTASSIARWQHSDFAFHRPYHHAFRYGMLMEGPDACVMSGS